MNSFDLDGFGHGDSDLNGVETNSVDLISVGHDDVRTGERNADECRLDSRLSEIIGGKRVLILGYGREGQSTYRTLSGIGGYLCLDIADGNSAIADTIPAGSAFIGKDYLDALDNYDIVFKSPGIVLPDDALRKSCRIVSQTDVFLSVYSSQMIGITGTKGKSTVTTLLHHVLQTSGFDSILAGNIGIPMFDVAQQITHDSLIVTELSCHQLEYCEHSPSIAVLLNLYEDHLDHYGTFERYIQAKLNIFRFQSEQDVLYTKTDGLPIAISAKSRIHEVDTFGLPFTRLEELDGVRLRGEHNLLNTAFVYDICCELGVDSKAFTAALTSYTPLPHRLEFIGMKNGVEYYDDSISTTVESSISAVQSISNAGTLILGGMDRGIDYTHLVDFLLACDLDTVICMYESGKHIYDMCLARSTLTEGLPSNPNGEHSGDVRSETDCSDAKCMDRIQAGERSINPSKRFVCVNDLVQAVELAKKHTLPGKACILSPAAASYGDFTNFEERGDVFKQLLFD